MIKYVFKMSITGPSLIKCEVTLTGHIQLSSHKPLNLASAQVTVLDRVERTDPAQSLLRHSGPEGSAARDGKLLQRRAVWHRSKPRSLRHERRCVASPSTPNMEIRPEYPTTESLNNALRSAPTGQPHGESDGAQCDLKCLHSISSTGKRALEQFWKLPPSTLRSRERGNSEEEGLEEWCVKGR